MRRPGARDQPVRPARRGERQGGRSGRCSTGRRPAPSRVRRRPGRGLRHRAWLPAARPVADAVARTARAARARSRVRRGHGLPRPAPHARSATSARAGRGPGDPHLRLGPAVPALDRAVPQGRSTDGVSCRSPDPDATSRCPSGRTPSHDSSPLRRSATEGARRRPPVLRLHLTGHGRPGRRTTEPHDRCPRRQPAARPAGPPAAPDRRALRHGDLRRHRRPVPQEGDAGDLRPRQPGPAAARGSASSATPAATGRTRTSPRSSTTRSRSTPAPSSARRSGSSSPRASGSCRATSTTTPPSTSCAGPSTNSTRTAAPRATTRSTCRSRRASSPTSSASSRSTGSPTPGDGAWRRVVVEKPFGHDLESARELNPTLDRGLPARVGVPHRPLPRQGDRAEHPGDAVRQHDVRADLERQLRRPRADHHGRGHRHRRPGRVLRRHRRRPRRHPEPPAPAAGADRDGGADLVRRREPAHREAEGARPRQAAPAARPGDRPRPVRRRLGRAGRRCRASSRRRASRRLHHRDLRRGQARRGHPPLGRGAVLPAHRQAARPPGHRGRDGVQARAAPAVHRDRHRGARAERAGVPGPARRGHDDPVRLQGARHRDGDPRRQHGLRLRRLVRRVLARGLRAADPRRAARRPAAVPAARGGRAVLADPRPDRGRTGPRRTRREGRPEPTRPAPGDRRRPTRCWPATGRTWRRP